MYKAFFLISFLSFYFTSIGQKGTNQLKIIGELVLPANDYKVGGGGFIKGTYGVGKSAQLSLMAGVLKFASKDKVIIESTVRLVPVLVGYKYNISRFYIEPQIGYGEIGGRIKINGDYARPSAGAFYWAVGGGYDYKRIDAGLRYQTAHGKEDEFQLVSIHIGL